MEIVWTFIIGFGAGIIVKFMMPSDKETSGFILIAILGIVGAIVATFLWQSLDQFGPGQGQGSGLIGAEVGAIIILTVWRCVRRRALSRTLDDPTLGTPMSKP